MDCTGRVRVLIQQSGCLGLEFERSVSVFAVMVLVTMLEAGKGGSLCELRSCPTCSVAERVVRCGLWLLLVRCLNRVAWLVK